MIIMYKLAMNYSRKTLKVFKGIENPLFKNEIKENEVIKW